MDQSVLHTPSPRPNGAAQDSGAPPTSRPNSARAINARVRERLGNQDLTVVVGSGSGANVASVKSAFAGAQGGSRRASPTISAMVPASVC